MSKFPNLVMENGIMVPSYKNVKPVPQSQAIEIIDSTFNSIIHESDSAQGTQAVKEKVVEIIETIRGWINDLITTTELYYTSKLSMVNSNKKVILEFSDKNPVYNHTIKVLPYLLNDNPIYSAVSIFKGLVGNMINMVQHEDLSDLEGLRTRLNDLLGLRSELDSPNEILDPVKLYHRFYCTGYHSNDSDYEEVFLGDLRTDVILTRFYSIMELVKTSVETLTHAATVKLTELKAKIEVNPSENEVVESIIKIRTILEVFNTVLTAQKMATDSLYNIFEMIIKREVK